MSKTLKTWGMVWVCYYVLPQRLQINYLLHCSHDVLKLPVPSDDDEEGSVFGRSLSMPLSSDMMEKRLMSGSVRSLGESPRSKSSCSWLREYCSGMELDRNHLANSRPVNILYSLFGAQTHWTGSSLVLSITVLAVLSVFIYWQLSHPSHPDIEQHMLMHTSMQAQYSLINRPDRQEFLLLCVNVLLCSCGVHKPVLPLGKKKTSVN